jgi:hypothetical protein
MEHGDRSGLVALVQVREECLDDVFVSHDFDALGWLGNGCGLGGHHFYGS